MDKNSIDSKGKYRLRKVVPKRTTRTGAQKATTGFRSAFYGAETFARHEDNMK